MRIRSRRHRDHDDEPAQQRRSKRHLRDPRQPFSVAIPHESEGVDDEVADIDVPRFDRAVALSASARS